VCPLVVSFAEFLADALPDLVAVGVELILRHDLKSAARGGARQRASLDQNSQFL